MNTKISLVMSQALLVNQRFEHLLERLIPIADLVLKLWVANVFFKSGLTKIASFDTTIMLFTHEYNVPILSPVVAAYVGTATELILPILLVLGLAGRFSATALFVFNVVAMMSYPDISEAGIRDHIVWGIMLLVLMVHGPGKWSLDSVICKKLARKDNY